MGKEEHREMLFWTKEEYLKFADAMMAVSYTHLDVYKRQAEDGLGDTIKPRLLAAGADCSRVLVIDDQDQPLTMVDARPVSYTHLWMR